MKLLLLLFLLLLICYSYSKEHFQNKWTNTLKCLNLKNDELQLFSDNLTNTNNEPKKNLINFIQILENKGIEHSKIMNCFFPNS